MQDELKSLLTKPAIAFRVSKAMVAVQGATKTALANQKLYEEDMTFRHAAGKQALDEMGRLFDQLQRPGVVPDRATATKLTGKAKQVEALVKQAHASGKSLMAASGQFRENSMFKDARELIPDDKGFLAKIAAVRMETINHSRSQTAHVKRMDEYVKRATDIADTAWSICLRGVSDQKKFAEDCRKIEQALKAAVAEQTETVRKTTADWFAKLKQNEKKPLPGVTWKLFDAYLTEINLARKLAKGRLKTINQKFDLFTASNKEHPELKAQSARLYKILGTMEFDTVEFEREVNSWLSRRAAFNKASMPKK